MQAQELLQLIKERRSIRHYTDEPVSREDLEAILEAGRWAPSGLNNQPWRFLVIRPTVERPDKRREKLAECTKYARIVREAQALIAVFLEQESCYHPMKDHQGAGACIQNMLLMIHGLGLGAVWLGEIVNQEAQVLDVLGLSPDKYRFMALLALGHPAVAGGSKRLELQELLIEELA